MKLIALLSRFKYSVVGALGGTGFYFGLGAQTYDTFDENYQPVTLDFGAVPPLLFIFAAVTGFAVQRSNAPLAIAAQLALAITGCVPVFLDPDSGTASWVVLACALGFPILFIAVRFADHLISPRDVATAKPRTGVLAE